jgi:hypothetical protein
MLLVWNCLQINRLNTATLTVVETHLHFASDRIPNAPNDRLFAPTFEIVTSADLLAMRRGYTAGRMIALIHSFRLRRRILIADFDSIRTSSRFDEIKPR